MQYNHRAVTTQPWYRKRSPPLISMESLYLKVSQHARFLYHHAQCTSQFKSTSDVQGCCLQNTQPGKHHRLTAMPKKAATRNRNIWPGNNPAGPHLGAMGNQKLNITQQHPTWQHRYPGCLSRSRALRHRADIPQLCFSASEVHSTGKWFHESKLMVWITSNPESTTKS